MPGTVRVIKDTRCGWLHTLRWWCLGLSLALLAAPAHAAPKRVASINLCTDQLLMALADPDQIAAVSTIARDPRLSAVHEAASRLPVIAGSAEEVLKLKPDLVLAGSFTRRETREALARFGIRVETFDPVLDVGEAIAEVKRAAAILGQKGRGDDLARSIEQSLGAAQSTGDGLVVLPLQRRGFVAGGGTLMTNILTRLGANNAAGRIGVTSVAQVPTEVLLKAKPDVLLLEELDAEARDQGTALLLHPALARALPSSRRIELPVSASICAGPTLPGAIRTLAEGLSRMRAIVKPAKSDTQ